MLCVRAIKKMKKLVSNSFYCYFCCIFGKLEDIHHVKPWNTLDFGHFTVTGIALVKLISKFCFQLSPTSMTRVRLNASFTSFVSLFQALAPGTG